MNEHSDQLQKLEIKHRAAICVLETVTVAIKDTAPELNIQKYELAMKQALFSDLLKTAVPELQPQLEKLLSSHIDSLRLALQTENQGPIEQPFPSR